jgi:flavodoxin
MKNLVCYYSLEGNTDFIARTIAQKTRANLLKVKPLNDINDQGFKKYLIGGFQSITKHRPKLEDYHIPNETYDFLFLGSPVWAGSITPPIRSLLHSSTIKAEKIVLFSTYMSSKGRVFKQMKQYINQNKVVDEIGFSNVLKEKDKNLELINERINML